MSITAEDFLMGSGAKSAAFPTIGTIVGGRIVAEPTVQQQKDISTGKPKTWDDGNPMMQLVVKVQTDLRDPEDPEDDGVRAIYIKAQMKEAVAQAVKKAGAKSLEVGGVLKVAYTGDEPAKTKGFNDKKLYAAQYEKPANSASADFFGSSTPAADAPPF